MESMNPEILKQKVIDYYQTKESRHGYNLVLGGTKHFGYYPSGKANISEKQAQIEMERFILTELKLKPADKVLDAGCGQGRVACRITQQSGAHITGITIVPFEVESAKQFTKKNHVENTTEFMEMDFTKTTFANNYFDAIYSMETLMHAYDLSRTLHELRRILKPGGKIIFFTYSIPSESKLTKNLSGKMLAQYRHDLAFTIEQSAMHALPKFTDDDLVEILSDTGFNVLRTQVVNDQVRPSFQRLHRLAIVPHAIGRILRLEDKLLNTTGAACMFRWPLKYPKLFSYKIITAQKP